MTSNLPRTPETPSQTSPSSAEFPTKHVTSPIDTHSMPTPARSVNGSMSSNNAETSFEATHEDSSLKRKRDSDDQGDQEQKKKVHVEEPESLHSLTLNDLHLDVGEKYYLCKTPHTAQGVKNAEGVTKAPLREDLFERYNLYGIAKTVARTNPDGSKAVKLRKTYKNHIKDHGLVGSFDAVKKEQGTPGTLYELMWRVKYQDEDWKAEWTQGKEIEKGIPESLLPAGNKVFTMAKGPIPKDMFNPTVLGEGGNPTAPVESAKGVPNGSRTPVPQNSAVARPGKVASKADAQRPKRVSTKRTYGDSSFEGYGEGYVDDDNQDPGYSTGDGDGGKRKRPKKNSQGHGFQGGPMRQNSYGPGMVGA
ncbi:Rox3 mediator complex subunit-domain-containing protein [Rhexocercosporidium sp. MPI-PUGE-AT-0058]|nr:Rox3 mediator complex subunit-domain-containing protein [Rhexocercosporidium sp. MPI-PUGE-AT-0058]